MCQSFADWEWILIDDCSRETGTARVLEDFAASDARIRVIRRAVNGGIVAATNDGFAAARGEWIALLDHDDQLERDALTCVEEVVLDAPDVDYVYTDEVIIDQHGRTLTRLEKPGWSPARLRAQMYCGHLSVYRASLVQDLGGMRPDFDGAQDYDLALRVTERARRVAHIPRALYRWVSNPGSTANDAAAKPWAYAAGVRAVQEHCDRIGLRATVEATETVGVHRVRRHVEDRPLISIIIPTGGTVRDVWGEERCLVLEAVRSIVARTTYPEYEILCVVDAQTPKAVLEELEAVGGNRLRLIRYDGEFNFAAKSNLGAAMASGRVLVFLNDDTEVESQGWLEALLGPLADGDVGMTGAMLVFPDGTVQHAGQCMNVVPQHILYRYPADAPGPMSALLVERECAGVTGACAMIRRDVFVSVGGFSTVFPSNYNDVDLCLKVRNLGMRIVWTPDARLWHLESASRDPSVTDHDLEALRRRWWFELNADPYFAPSIADIGGYEARSWR